MDNILFIPGISPSLRQRLFSANEPGGIWDWSDRSTLFTDRAGTTPVTASGQTVGLHLDKSRGLTTGPESRQTGVIGITGTATPATYDPNTGIGECTRVDASNQSFVQFSGLVGEAFYRITATNTGSTNLLVRTGIQGGAVAYNFLIGQTATFHVSADNLGRIAMTTEAGTGSFSISSMVELRGNHRYQAAAASRPQYIQDGNIHYGLYDGSDDFMETNPVNFTSTNKVTTWWGGRKLSDAAAGFVFEFSTSTGDNTGSFHLNAPGGSPTRYVFRSRGSATPASDAGTADTAFNAPISNVLCGIGDISGAIARLRINGVQVAENLITQGTGNYGNHKLFFGRRAGTTLPANMREHLTIIRGAQTSDNLIAQVEREVARKVGISW